MINVKALITGASSGIGRSMAIYLANLDYELILVGRDQKKLEELQKSLKMESKVIIADLADIKINYFAVSFDYLIHIVKASPG